MSLSKFFYSNFFNLVNYAKRDLSNVENDVILQRVVEVSGQNSNIDADTVDGKHGSDFADKNLTNVGDLVLLEKLKNVDGHESGLNADMVDGVHLQDILDQVIQRRNLSTVSTDTTINETVEIYLVDATINAVTITLDTTLTPGFKYSIKKIDSSSNMVTLVPSSGNIDGQSSYDLLNKNDSITVVCDGNNWWII